jgi:hypothetical protein
MFSLLKALLFIGTTLAFMKIFALYPFHQSTTISELSSEVATLCECTNQYCVDHNNERIEQLRQVLHEKNASLSDEDQTQIRTLLSQTKYCASAPLNKRTTSASLQ